MFNRTDAITEMRALFLKRAFPRLMMSLLLVISGGAAFLVAFGLLHAGVVSMAVRYGVAALAGYVLLLGMFRLWLWAAVRRIAGAERESDTTVADVVADWLSNIPLPGPGSADKHSGGGGGFGGGGGGSSWGGGDSTAVQHSLSASRRTMRAAPRRHASSAHHDGSTSGSGGDGGLDLDLDDGWIIVIPIIAAVAIGVVVIGVVWTAPTLFAELLLDGLLSAGIYRGLRRWEANYSLESAVRRTRWAAAAVIIIAAAAGYLIQHFAPDTVSIGDLWR